jgi:hypothetical protein
LEVENHSA